MTIYSSDICIFMKETTINQLIDHLPGQTEVPPKFSLIEAKIGEDASKCTLEQLNRIRRRYCSEVKLSEIVFHLVAIVESNSFIVKWLVPSSTVPDIMNSARNVNQSFYQEYRITSLTLDGMWLFLSEAEIDAIWSQVHVSDAKFKDQFHTMYKHIVYQLEMGEISKYQLSLHFVKSFKCQQHIADHLSQALLNHEFPASFVDFQVLTAVVERLGSDYLKKVMRSYCKYMSTFVKESTVQQLMNLSTIQHKSFDYSIAKCRVKKEPSQYRLEKLLHFRSKFLTIANFDEVCIIIDEVSTETRGSFTVSWLVPSVIISDMMKSTRNIGQSFYQQYNITSLTLDGMWLFLSEAEIDMM